MARRHVECSRSVYPAKFVFKYLDFRFSIVNILVAKVRFVRFLRYSAVNIAMELQNFNIPIIIV